MFKSVSIVIPALNEEKNIAKCVRAIAAIDRCSLDIETIVIDNGSTDRTVEIARALGARVLVKSGVNVAEVRNYGVRHSGGELLAFVDADCVVAKDWLREALNTIEKESADAVGSFHVIPAEAGWIGRTAELIQHKKVGNDVRYIPSGNLIVKRSCFEAIGGFKASLETSEDVDLSIRLKDSGCKLFLDPKISSVHLGSPMSIGEMFKREMWHGKAMWPAFIRDIRSGKPLRSARNLRLVLYSSINLLLIIGIIGTLYPLYQGQPVPLLVSSVLYLLLNLTVALNDWRRLRKNLLQLFGYCAIYGVARSISVLRWLVSGAPGMQSKP